MQWLKNEGSPLQQNDSVAILLARDGNTFDLRVPADGMLVQHMAPIGTFLVESQPVAVVNTSIRFMTYDRATERQYLAVPGEQCSMHTAKTLFATHPDPIFDTPVTAATAEQATEAAKVAWEAAKAKGNILDQLDAADSADSFRHSVLKLVAAIAVCALLNYVLVRFMMGVMANPTEAQLRLRQRYAQAKSLSHDITPVSKEALVEAALQQKNLGGPPASSPPNA